MLLRLVVLIWLTNAEWTLNEDYDLAIDDSYYHYNGFFCGKFNFSVANEGQILKEHFCYIEGIICGQLYLGEGLGSLMINLLVRARRQPLWGDWHLL